MTRTFEYARKKVPSLQSSTVQPSEFEQSSSLRRSIIPSVISIMDPQGCSGRPPHNTPVQAKPKIGRPGDRYEQEADRIAAQVMRMPEPGLQRQPT
jgi:hypothetical protein